MRGREGKERSTVGEMERGGGEGCCIFSDGKDRGCRSRQEGWREIDEKGRN